MERIVEQMHLSSIKPTVLAIFGTIGSALTGFLGGWDMALQTLLLFMVMDYITGLAVAGVFHKSPKSETGGLKSFSGWLGIFKKLITLGLVVVAAALDRFLGLDYIRYGIIIAFMSNELISILENAGLMGIPIPKILINAIDILKKEEGNKKEVSK